MNRYDPFAKQAAERWRQPNAPVDAPAPPRKMLSLPSSLVGPTAVRSATPIATITPSPARNPLNWRERIRARVR